MSKKKTEINAHNNFFVEFFGKEKYSIELLKLILPKEVFDLFNWQSLRFEATTFITSEGLERRTDLILLVEFKESADCAKIIFLLEHKAQKRPQDVLLQLLDYQTGLYHKQEGALVPVVPIIVYNGETKDYHGPVRFQSLLEGFDNEVKNIFGRYVLNFECFFLNVHEIKLDSGLQKEFLNPIIFVMQSIFRLDEKIISELFLQGDHLDENERAYQLSKALEYIKHHNKNFSWRKIQEIERKTVKEERRYVVQLMQSTLERVEAKGLEKGLKKGLKKGLEKGLEKGREEGREEGLEKGLEKGREEGLEKGKRA